jgi:hypothetical protein
LLLFHSRLSRASHNIQPGHRLKNSLRIFTNVIGLHKFHDIHLSICYCFDTGLMFSRLIRELTLGIVYIIAYKRTDMNMWKIVKSSSTSTPNYYPFVLGAFAKLSKLLPSSCLSLYLPICPSILCPSAWNSAPNRGIFMKCVI